MRLTRCWIPFAALLLGAAACAPTRPAPSDAATPHAAFRTPHSELPGRKADGSILLPNQWSLRPTGRQVELGDFPVNIAVHPGGRFVAVLHAGYSQHEVLIVDLRTEAVVSRVNLHETFYGLEFSQDGKRLFCSGAGDECVHVFDFQDGKLTHHSKVQLRDASLRAVPCGLALDRSARHLFVTELWADRITRVDLGATPRVTDIHVGTNDVPISLAPTPPPEDSDTAAAEKRARLGFYRSDIAGSFPYACRLDERGHRLYVSLWAHGAVAVVDLDSDRVIARWPTQEHPCEMALTRDGKRLFVANANRNTVTVFETETGKVIETIWAALYPKAPSGSTPNSLALSPDERTLFVANADNNMVAVFDVSTPGKSRSLGFIPVGWYPTSVRVTPDGKHLLVTNGKGVRPLANPNGPQPGRNSDSNPLVQYIARLFRGTLSIIELPPQQPLQAWLRAYTAQTYRCSPLNAKATVTTSRPAHNPIPLKPGDPSPIKYCLYIIKENRTYDQVLGDMPEGNGDAQLCLFPERVTPNHHKLARQFVLLDNFYAESEVSADGHEWSMGAYASDFVEKTWPLKYGHGRDGKYPFPAEGFFPIAFPAGGYLWDRAREAGVSYRSYGEFVENGATPQQPVQARLRGLEGHIDPWYEGFELSYPDAKRADRFISELKRFEAAGDMPRLQIVRLPNDHTHGVTPGWHTPEAYVAEHDQALGRIIEAVSHSKFWPQTAIFIVEDDAQNGPDHVDAHRTVAFVVSPYVKHSVVDSTLYSTCSMLRTMELILGLKPMSQFDAAARPMFNAFQATPDLQPYQALPARIDLTARNGKRAWGSGIKMNFSREDAADDILLNEVIWRSVKGRNSVMPAPVRAGFVFALPKDKDDD